MTLKLNYDTAALRVCVDGVDEGRIWGRVAGQRLSAPMTFHDITHLILQIEAVLDIQKYPQAFQRIRTFTPSSAPAVPAARDTEEMMPVPLVESLRGARGTFSLRIATRQNATWQGSVDHLDGEGTVAFQSILELIMHLDQRYVAHTP